MCEIRDKLWSIVYRCDMCVSSVQCALGVRRGCKCRLTPPGALARATFNMRNRFLELLTPVQHSTASLSLPPPCVTRYLNIQKRDVQRRCSLKNLRSSTSHQHQCSALVNHFTPHSVPFVYFHLAPPSTPLGTCGLNSVEVPLLPPGPALPRLPWVSCVSRCFLQQTFSSYQ